ncbi:hypothetical protein [Marinobacterium aestuariivivens]|uniref:VOC domain-containing protein n=1 Tax=Marinobacterium aestuariivivens TaxID=1698799 RepID=A0ABW1ZZC5_9GAMM
MAYNKGAYVEHAAIRVNDIHWHIRFFKEVLGMPVREIDGPEDNPNQYWTVGGIQLIATPGFEAPRAMMPVGWRTWESWLTTWMPRFVKPGSGM